MLRPVARGRRQRLLAAVADDRALRARRSYRKDTLVLETEFTTDTGVVRLVDCMPIRENHPQVVRLVEGVSGTVDMCMTLAIRFSYGSVLPWVRRSGSLLSAIAGPDALSLWTPVRTHGEDMTTVAEFAVREGEQVPFVLTWFASHEEAPRPVDAFRDRGHRDVVAGLVVHMHRPRSLA